MKTSGPLCKCTKCGSVFPSRAFSGKNSVGTTIIGGRETCPKCGAMANVMDGVYNFDKNGLAELVRGTAFTKEIYDQFKALIKEAQTKKFTKDEFFSKASEIDSNFAIQLKKFFPNDSSSLSSFLTFLLTLLIYITQDNKPQIVNNTTNITNNYNTSSSKALNHQYKGLDFYPSEKSKKNGISSKTSEHTNDKQRKQLVINKKKKIKIEPVKNDSTRLDYNKTKALINQVVRKK